MARNEKAMPYSSTVSLKGDADRVRHDLASEESDGITPDGTDAADMKPQFVTNLRPRDDSGGPDWVTRNGEWRDGGIPVGPEKFTAGSSNMKRGGKMTGRGW